MREPFIYKGTIPRIVFGIGTISKVAEELHYLGRRKSLVLSTPFQEQDAQRLAEHLGSACVGVFSGAVMHTPVEMTIEALRVFADTGADCVSVDRHPRTMCISPPPGPFSKRASMSSATSR